MRCQEEIGLQGFLASIPLKHLARKTLIGRKYVHLGTLLLCLQVEYQNGAVLGRAMLDKLDILEKMLAVPGVNESRYGQVIKDAQEAAKQRLDKFKMDHGDEPENFGELIYWPHWEIATGLSFSEVFEGEEGHYEIHMRTRKRQVSIIHKALGEKIPLQQAHSLISHMLSAGLGFGTAFPSLTERMLKKAYEETDEEMEHIARQLGFPTSGDVWRSVGLTTSGEPAMTLKQQEEVVLRAVAIYASEYYPELLSPLGLQLATS